METTNENPNVPKQRHGCVTAWLILMIVANSLSAGLYLFAREMVTKSLPGEVSTPMIILLGILAIGNIVFSVMLFQWKKLGFWGFVVTTAGALIINLTIGLGVGQSLFGLAGIAILYGVFQIKQGNFTAWENLE
ncbi:MAG: hypothetical protein M0R39_09145 [Prolixibacteraceae bacterium]|nr:hypothetical protein [Prolixibacteraceae bacterium]